MLVKALEEAEKIGPWKEPKSRVRRVRDPKEIEALTAKWEESQEKKENFCMPFPPVHRSR